MGSIDINDTVNNVQHLPFYGFGVNGAAVALAGSPNSTIKVPQGTTLTINLSQSGISDPIDLSFPSIPASDVSHVGNVYTVVADKVGTSVFQPGTNPDAPRQVAMGLVGTLIVTPAGCTSPTLSCAYDGAVSYSDEVLIATTDLDYAFATGEAGFEMGYFGQSPNPDGSPRKVYHVVNGKAFPDTDVIDVRAGDSVLLRSVNAGVTDKSMGILGMRQTLLGPKCFGVHRSADLHLPARRAGRDRRSGRVHTIGCPAGTALLADGSRSTDEPRHHAWIRWSTHLLLRVATRRSGRGSRSRTCWRSVAE